MPHFMVNSELYFLDNGVEPDDFLPPGYRAITDAEADVLRLALRDVAAEKAATMAKARELRELILNRLTGIQVNTTDVPTIAAIQAARQALLDFTADAAVVAAVTGEATKQAVLLRWYAIASALTASAPTAASVFVGMGLE